jgi:hypothetical protein
MFNREALSNDAAEAVAEQNDRPGLRLHDFVEIFNVLLEAEWCESSRALVPTSVIGNKVKILESARKSAKGGSTVEAPMNADNCGFRVIYTSLGDGQTRDDGFSGKYQRTGRKGERRHTENLMDGI